MEKFAGVNKIESQEGGWPFNIDKIEDRAKKNYFSLLPDADTLNACFGEAFVINEPVRSVGGDGYWLYEVGPVIFIAVFDCEGEGHLASMMTRIYAKALKKLIVDNAIEFPGSILQFIHREIQSKFKNRENIQLNTGADLGIMRIDLERNEIEYAGAGMDLLRINNAHSEIIPGDSLKIGELFDHKHEYNSVSVKFEPGSKYYLYTDGITNLQGGSSSKGFGTDNLQELLRKNAHLSMNEQRKLVTDTLHDWSGGGIRYDDMLMIGFTL